MADYDIPVYPGTMRYNPQASVKGHGIIIGCLIFHGLLMYVRQSKEGPSGVYLDSSTPRSPWGHCRG